MLMEKDLKPNGRIPPPPLTTAGQGRAPLRSPTLSQQAIHHFTNLQEMERRVNLSTLTGNQTQVSHMLCKHASYKPSNTETNLGGIFGQRTYWGKERATLIYTPKGRQNQGNIGQYNILVFTKSVDSNFRAL